MTTIIIGYRADIAHPRAALIRYRNLLMVLNALNNQTAFRLTYKIILIEQDTDKVICDDVKALVDDYFWYYCSRPFNRGDAFNVGAGISEADRDDCLCLTDADLLPGETWIEQCLGHMEKAEALIPFQKIMRLSRAGTLQLYCGKRDVDYDKPTGPSVGGVMWLRRELFERVDGFDPRFEGWGAEDNDFFWRVEDLVEVQRADLPLQHLWHPYPNTDQKQYEKNLKLLARKHPARAKSLYQRYKDNLGIIGDARFHNGE